MLGLDSACASLTEPGDNVLVLSNGIFGEGFKGLVKTMEVMLLFLKLILKKLLKLIN